MTSVQRAEDTRWEHPFLVDSSPGLEEIHFLPCLECSLPRDSWSTAAIPHCFRQALDSQMLYGV